MSKLDAYVADRSLEIVRRVLSEATPRDFGRHQEFAVIVAGNAARRGDYESAAFVVSAVQAACRARIGEIIDALSRPADGVAS